MILTRNMNYKKIAMYCAMAFVFGLFFGWVLFPKILRRALISQTALKPGSRIRGMWTNIPFPLEYRIYLFNVTNPDEVQKGGKPHLQEIGPYYFEEWKTKIDMVDHKEDDTVEFKAVDTFIFKPELSYGLTGNEIISFPNIFLLSMILKVAKDRAPMLPLVIKAGNEMFQHPTSIFIKAKAMDILFNGLGIDCSSEDFSVKAVCSSLEVESKSLVKYNETAFMISLFGAKNATPSGVYTVYRGMKNIHDLGRVIMYDGEPELDIFDGDECNQFHGTDGTIFPPFMSENEGLWAFSPDICRSLAATYERPSSYVGIPTSRYTLRFGTMKDDVEGHCFCEDPPDGCPPYGVLDLSICMGAPLYGSLPHFYDADPSLLAKVIGLNPNPEKHKVVIDFERTTGTPLSASKKLQINIKLLRIEEYEIMKNIPEIYFPLFWLDEAVQLNNTYSNMIKYQLLLALKINWVIKWSCVIFGLFGGITSVYMHYKKRSSKKAISPRNMVTEVMEEKSPPDSANIARNLKNVINNKTEILSNSNRFERY